MKLRGDRDIKKLVMQDKDAVLQFIDFYYSGSWGTDDHMRVKMDIPRRGRGRPVGFKCIGRGLDRECFLYNGLVYKFSKGTHSNFREFEDFRRLSRPKSRMYFGKYPVRFPKVVMIEYNGYSVLAAEYIKSDTKPKISSDYEFLFADLHAGNIRIKNGKFYLIDGG